MTKYIFNVYDTESREKIASVMCTVDEMAETVKTLNKLGIVKGYIMRENESEEK